MTGMTGNGWWGQFITREGTLNRERAAALLATGEFRYPRMQAQCPYEDFCAHLDSLKHNTNRRNPC